jgi:hypothetical protein
VVRARRELRGRIGTIAAHNLERLPAEVVGHNPDQPAA